MSTIPIDLVKVIENTINQKVISSDAVLGGDITKALLLRTEDKSFFFKYSNDNVAIEMMACEAYGLNYLAKQKVLSVPGSRKLVEFQKFGGLIMDFVLKHPKSERFWINFGSGLAKLHKITRENFGFDGDNFIGRLHQSNPSHDSWHEFYANERILPQVKLAVENGFFTGRDRKTAETFCNKIVHLCPPEAPALLHGDLWSGNYLCGPGEIPFIIDPSVYFGHREMDIGMTRLFGGFDDQFYETYNESYPLASGWQERLKYSQLYYLLIHLNMFGRSYLSSVRNILAGF